MTRSIQSFLHKEVEIETIDNRRTPEDNLSFKQLEEFEVGINWDELVNATFQAYLESNIGRLIVPTESMLKVYFLQYRYGMLATDIETALHEVNAFREFALEIDFIPKASSIREFARLLKDNKLDKKVETAFLF